MGSAIRVKWLPPATIFASGESLRQREMVWRASGDRQVAEQVTPITSAFVVETESAIPFHEFLRARGPHPKAWKDSMGRIN